MQSTDCLFVSKTKPIIDKNILNKEKKEMSADTKLQAFYFPALPACLNFKISITSSNLKPLA